jgi:transposase
MGNIIMCGTDVHENSLVNQIGVNKEDPKLLQTGNTIGGRKKLFSHLKKIQKKCGGQIILGYEASSLGYGLYDACRDAGIECVILAPTKIKKSVQNKQNKTDIKDALEILEILRGHYLAGNKLPKIWIPDDRTRDDREIVRNRLDLSDKLTSLKAQVQTLLKRAGLRKPKTVGSSWSKKHRKWLSTLNLNKGRKGVLESLLRQISFLEEEIKRSDKDVEALSQQERYKVAFEVLVREIKGVGLVTAMVFLTEMGDLSRFKNRKQIGAFLGLVPKARESGEKTDQKGHITRAGSWRLRKVICQATWARVKYDAKEKVVYEKIVARNRKHKKIAVVACMRRLSIVMWRTALHSQQQAA